MEKQINILKSLYSKQAILYTINLYLEDIDYNICEDDNNYIIDLINIDEDDYKLIKSELTFNSLRFEIADQNKELRKAIISQAL
ncbi:hypothetical protein HOG21_00900 [bacterium]|jgi:His-Xaa-Ser system protein HxsD|nr:hypothetical protein [bacterium]